jgi:hypothetical protein
VERSSVSISKFVTSVFKISAVPKFGLGLAISSVIRKIYALYFHGLCGPEFTNQIWFLLPVDVYLSFYFWMRCLNKQVGMGGANVYPESSDGWKSFMDLMMMITLVGINVMWHVYMPSTCP